MFGSLMGDFDDDMGFMGNPMNAIQAHMRSMNRLMNSFNPDPFNMLAGFDNGLQSNALMERGNGMGGLFGFPAMPNINRLLNADIGAGNGSSFCSSSVITMSSGPDGRPQIYQASQSTKTGPGGIRETRKTVQDSVSGVKKMAIGHHIGERAHIIEKEQDLRSGQLEERQEFINLQEEQAEEFDREFINRASRSMGAGGRNGPTQAIRAGPSGQREVLTIEEIDDDEDEEDYLASKNRRQLALPAPPQHHNHTNSDSTKDTTTTTRAGKGTSSSSSSSAGSNARNKSANVSSSASASATTNSPMSPTSPTASASGHRRAYRNHLTGGITSRRPIRSPTSSPLATTPTIPSYSTITTSPSVHPHPYNASGRRSHHHRSPKHHHGHKQQSKPDLDGVVTVKPIKKCHKDKKHTED